MPPADPRFIFDGFEHKIVGVDLTVRMWIGHADRLAFVFEDQHVFDLWTTTKIQILFLPDVQKILDPFEPKLAQREIMFWAVANYASDPARWAVAVDSRRRG